MASPYSKTTGIQWTPPSTPANSGNSTVAVQGSVNVASSGQVDVPAATTLGTVFAIPFGSVSKPLFFAMRNKMSSDIGIRFNGHNTNDFKISAGAYVEMSMPAPTVDEPLSSCSFVTTAAPAALELVEWWVFGD